MRLVLLALASSVVLAFVGCGDDDGGDPAGESPASQTTSTPSAPAPGAEGDQENVHKGTPLKKEIYPRCGVEAYGSPSVSPVPQFGGFRLIYTHEDAENPVAS